MAEQQPQVIPSLKPRHVAIIMDGNGRWAKKRNLPRIGGHRAGAEAVGKTVKKCAELGIEVLTLFAFSSENWDRPSSEVSFLMRMFLRSLRREIDKLHENKIQLRVIGSPDRFNPKLQDEITRATALTQNNTGLKLVIAANYGGRWDMTEATRKIAHLVKDNNLTINQITPELISTHLATTDLPEPDLLIRTSGEQRISNFLLWQFAYTELFFTPVFWPDFNEATLEEALAYYATRERRFGGITKKSDQELVHA